VHPYLLGENSLVHEKLLGGSSLPEALPDDMASIRVLRTTTLQTIVLSETVCRFHKYSETACGQIKLWRDLVQKYCIHKNC